MKQSSTSKLHQARHPFHLVTPSPWPLVGAIAAFLTAMGIVLLIHHHGIITLLLGAGLIIFTMIGWWRDVIKEANTKGIYTPPVQLGLKIGMVLFILTEVMFFVAFFWAFFHASLFPSQVIGGVWPPKGLTAIEPFDFPYFNTLVLLLSGTTITWAHHAMLQGQTIQVLKGIGLTIGLGITFLLIQAYEYAHAHFGFTEGIYSSVFYMITGFHGAHVIIGTVFLCICWIRTYLRHFTKQVHIGFEAAAWYWHFVDVIWLLLFVCVYWWGSGL